MPLPLDQWAKVETIFLAAAELPRAERELFLDRACGADTDLRYEVMSLLRYDTRDGPPLLAALQAGAASLVDGPAEGCLVGPYRIDRELGRGGMAVVYLGSRADGEFHKQVAVKLVKRGMDTDAVIQRLRRERGILAALDHPYVARLLDGGSTSEGLPYIVMEFVEGIPIDRYSSQHDLTAGERCQLMDKVFDAVAYAHRNLVIHLDLKPSNILVTADGNPKLLDFGIAKLLGGDGRASDGPLTRGAYRCFTPEYSSPEQIAGGPVGTTADVYSLGVVLYEVLAGVRPRADVKASAAATEAGCSRRWARSLEGDLDNILQMALCPEAERRYLSVTELQSDLRLHLQGMPIAARDENLLERGRKFVRRHRVGVLAAGLVGASLLAGMGTTLWQAQRAETQRALAEVERGEAQRGRELAHEEAVRATLAQQRAEAEHQEADRQRAAADSERQLAERRFGQVHQLAGKFLLDFHDSIAALPGSTAARKMVIETGLQYYDSLVKESSGNRTLLEEAARGYDRLGDVQGNIYYTNVGDSRGALESYRKALAIREKITDPAPAFQRDSIQGKVRIAQILTTQGQVAEARGILQEAIDQARRSPAAEALIVRVALADTYRVLGDAISRTGDWQGAIEPYQHCLDLYSDAAGERPDMETNVSGVGGAHARLAQMYRRLGRYRESLDHVRPAIDIFTRLEAKGNNINWTRNLFATHNMLADLLNAEPRLGAPGEEKKNLDIDTSLADRMLANDPSNTTALFDVALAQGSLGNWYIYRTDDPAASVAPFRKAMDSIEKYASLSPPGAFTYDALIYSRINLALGLERAGRLEEAMAELRNGEAELERAEKQSPGTLLMASRGAFLVSIRAETFERQKKWENAIADYQSAIARFEGLRARDPKNGEHLTEIVRMLPNLANCYAALEQWNAAVRTAETALQRIGELRSIRPLSEAEEHVQNDCEAKAAGWKSR